MSNRKKLQEAKQRLEELLYPEEYDINIDEVDVDEEVGAIFDSLDEISQLYESDELNPTDANIYRRIIDLKRDLAMAYDLFDIDLDTDIANGFFGFTEEDEE